MLTIEQLNALPDTQDWQNAFVPKAPTQKKKSFWLDQISTAGGILGGIGGSFIAPIAGTAAGAGAGSALGEAIENAIMGEDLGKNVVQEGALGALFGAGPIKLAKGAVAGGLQLAKGAGGTVAKEAAKKAAVTPLRQMAGKSLTGTADNLAVKQFRLTPSQLASFKSKYGEDAGKTIRKYGFTSVDDVTSKGIQPLQQQFNDNVASIGVVSKQSLQDNFNSRIAKLASGKASDNAAKAQMLKQEADSVLSKFGDTIDAKELNIARQEFDKLVNYTNKAADPAKYSVNKYVADGMRETLQKADPTGTLKNIGSELSKLMQLSKNVAQQSELGRGSLPVGLNNLLGAGVGAGAAGGPLGALGGYAASQMANSNAGRKLALSGVEKLGTKLASTETSTMSPLGIAGRLGAYGAVTQTGDQPQNLEDALTNQSLSNNIDPTSMTNTSMNPPMNSNIPSTYSDQQQSASPFGVSATQIGQALMQAYAAGDKAGIAQLQGMYELASEYEAAQAKANSATTKPLGIEAQKMQNNAASGMKSLNDLEQIINSDESVVNRASMPDIAGLNTILGTSQYRAAITNVQDAMTRLRSGASMNEQESQRFDRMLPRFGDSKEVIQYKIDQFKDYFTQVASQVPSDSTSDLTSALLQAQNQY